MSNPNDAHTLNACLARVIGVEVTEGKDGNDTVWFLTEEWVEEGWDEFTEWNPIKNANQMEKVEAWLKGQGVEFIITSAHLINSYIVELIGVDKKFFGQDPDKKRALALAVQAMEQSNNNNNKED